MTVEQREKMEQFYGKKAQYFYPRDSDLVPNYEDSEL
jgi:hypothetical protein